MEGVRIEKPEGTGEEISYYSRPFRFLRKAEFPAAPPRIQGILAGWSRLRKAQ